MLRVLKGIATRDYEACAEAVPAAFGLSRSSVSRRYVKGTARKLAEFQERSLEGYDLVALFLDGKSFADEEVLIALGVTLDGHKIPLVLEKERRCPTMPKSHGPYPPEFRQQMVELVRAGRSPEALAKEFEPSGQTIRNWVIQAERDEGVRRDGPSRPEQEELRRLRRENKQLRIEGGILAKATAWFAREADSGSGPSTSS